MENLARREGSANLYYLEVVPSDMRSILAVRDENSPRKLRISLGTPDHEFAKLQLVRMRAARPPLADIKRVLRCANPSRLAAGVALFYSRFLRSALSNMV